MYNVKLNTAKIRKIKGVKIEKSKVHKYIDIDNRLLVEKDNWYFVDKNVVSFFKARTDFRLFGECLSEDIFKRMGIESAKYEIVFLNSKLGLLTPNFQDLDKNSYYDLYTISKLFPSLNTNYNKLTFKSLLETISYQDIPNKEELIQELIDRYVGEWATHQTDGNPRNLMISRSKTDGLLKVAPSFDREKCFGIDNNGYFNPSESSGIWIPAIPYNDLDFRTKPYTYDEGLDINILELFFDYPEETEKAFSRVFGINYHELFSKYKKNIFQFSLEENTINYLCDIIDKKDKQKQKILSLR